MKPTARQKDLVAKVPSTGIILHCREKECDDNNIDDQEIIFYSDKVYLSETSFCYHLAREVAREIQNMIVRREPVV